MYTLDEHLLLPEHVQHILVRLLLLITITTITHQPLASSLVFAFYNGVELGYPK